MSQLTFNNTQNARIEGQLADSSMDKDVITKTNSTRQLEAVSIDNATNDDVYSVTINGTVFDITSDGTATVTEIRDALKVDIDAGSEPVLTTASGADVLLIESTLSTAGFTISVTADVPSDISVSQQVPQAQELAFGRVVINDALRGDDFIRLPRLTGEVTGGGLIGVSLSDTAREENANGYADKAMVRVLRNGRCIMRCEDAVVLGGAVFVRFVAGVGEELGRVRSDADGADAVALPGATYRESAAAGALVVVELR